jgi:cytochrome c oxidase accessory protein FixG
MSAHGDPPVADRRGAAPRRVLPILPADGGPGIAPAVRIQARSVRGVFARWRLALIVLTQLVFYGLPWLPWGDRPAVWFDLDGGRFFLFDAVLFPPDLIHLTGLLVFSALLLFCATAVAGRVWCGFACPQTVYTAMFMGIERWTEGDRLARLRLDAAPWGLAKIARRGSRQALWLALSLWTGFSLVAWFTPPQDLAAAVASGTTGPWETFWCLFYAGATYVHAGLLREKVCQHACPYGRFQGAMLDRETWVVGYDRGRGEPRGARPRGSVASARGQGDCVDCTLCVQVCPVGIDIRDGLQAACISCGLCIDACNGVMDKLGAPRGLLRFGSFQGETGPGDGLWRTALRRRRVQAYALTLCGLALAMIGFWQQRPLLRVEAIRDRGVMSRQLDDGSVENVYRLRVLNATARDLPLHLSAVLQPPGGGEPLRLTVHGTGPLRAPAASISAPVVTVRVPAEALAQLPSRSVLPLQLRIDAADEAGVADGSDVGGAGPVARTDSTLLLP